MGWHHPTPNRGRLGGLSLSWVHDDGHKIYQGRPFPDQRRFVYRLVQRDGRTSDFDYIKDAKLGIAPAREPAPNSTNDWWHIPGARQEA